VHVTWRPVGLKDVAGSGSVVGRAIPDLGLYVLDALSQPQPVGVPGEIHVGGAGLASGYLGRPELTAARFVPNPYGEPGSRLYRSVDLARFLADGDLEYLGRIDHQVKIRGFRIELGEIESALASHPSVRESVVLAREDGAEKRLVAYVVPEGSAPTLSELREALAENLPEYMLPSALVVLAELPLTTNGKVDRRALPSPDVSRSGLESSYVAPAYDLELFLAGLWQEVLAIPQAGLHDDFFLLGGNSITGAVLVNRLQQELREIVQVVVIFDAPTISELATYLIDQHPAAVARLFGPEALGGRGLELEDATAPIGEGELSVLRGLIRPLPPLPEARRSKNPGAVFVLSPPRSGSTLLRVMLGGHPQLFSPPELELLSFNTLQERKAAFAGRDAFWLEGVIRAVMEIRGCGAEEAEALVEECEREDLTTLDFYGRMQEWLGGRILVDKTPSYTLDPSILRRAEEGFEEPRYIHLIRHPLGMIHSFEEAKLDQIFFRQEHPFTRRQLAELIWLSSHQNIMEFLREVPAGRQHWVHFEDLLAEPEATLRSLCGFLGLDYHPDMAEPYKRKSARMTDGVHAESRMLGDVKFHQHAGVEASVAERWRDHYGRDFLGGVTWRLASRLGYEREPLGGLTPIEPGGWSAGEPLPLSFAQQRLWFLEQLQPGTPTYNIPDAVRLCGDLDVAALRRSLREVLRRHASLRTTFAVRAGQPVQVVADSLELPLPLIDLRALPTELRAAAVLRLTLEERRRSFDLSTGPLIRTLLIRVEEDEHVALLTMHHIVSDGWSMGILIREIGTLYGSFAAGQPSPLPEPPIQYADYALWQRRWLDDAAVESQLSYWRERLAGVPVLQLPSDRPRPALQSYQGSMHPFALSEPLSAALRSLARERGVTVFMAFLASFQALLSRYSGQKDFAVGSPESGRDRREIEGLIGFFVNTLILRAPLEGDPGTGELLSRVRAIALEAFAHQSVPFERIVQELAPERNLSYSPLFQAMLTVQHAPQAGIEVPGLSVVPVISESAVSKFDLTLTVFDSGAQIFGNWVYSTALFEAETIARWSEHFKVFLEGFASGASRRVSDLPLLTTAEREQILVDWNRPPLDYPDEGVVHRLFEEQVERTPDAVAVVFEGAALTYRELNVRANRLAHRLRRLGVAPEALVGISAERSFEMVVGLLAILKAGGAYV
ncbi:MAG TPA: condensation domain-containing protein, partial [Thermoanaerobaculia bacterium]|nr:condensation domain-containing protein [Thermoanaerobaculia bacterium]